MIKIAYCQVCNRKLIGETLNGIGDRYYCHSHYSMELEKPVNRYKKIQDKKFKRLLTEFENLIDTDITNWNLIECSETDNEITT